MKKKKRAVKPFAWCRKNGHWHMHLIDSYFRRDMAYAGTDHTKNNKTFIAIAPYLEVDGTVPMLTGFKTIQAAMNAADKCWPMVKKWFSPAEIKKEKITLPAWIDNQLFKKKRDGFKNIP